MSKPSPEFQMKEQPRIEFIERLYEPRKNELTEEEIKPLYSEAADLAQQICTLGFYKYRKPYSPRGMSGLHYTNTHALSLPVPYTVVSGEQIELGMRYSTSCTGDDPIDLADPDEKVIELGVFRASEDKNKAIGKEDHSRLDVRADLRHHMLRSFKSWNFSQYPKFEMGGGYYQNRPEDLESFMKGVRYIAHWLDISTATS